MDMDIVFLKEFDRNIVLIGICLDEVQGDLGRFDHDIAQLTGNDQIALALEVIDFDRQNVTAKGSIRQTGNDADLVLLEDVELKEEAGGDGGDDFSSKAEKFETAFTAMLEEHPESLESAAKFKAYMSDLMPDNDLQVYLIHNLYKMDIARAIREADEITELFPARFVSRLVGDFGVSTGLARWAASVWCVCYGERVLKKKNNVVIYYVSDI